MELKKRMKAALAWKRVTAFVIAAALVFAAAVQAPLTAAAAGASCKALCQAALKATGNAGKLKHQSSSAKDFAGFTVSDQKKVSSLMYICDDKEVYSICVVKAKSSSNAADLLKSLKAYKSNNTSSNYLSDYSSSEQKVFKNAVCGRSGKYVWYIAMSTSKAVNKKGQAAIKKKL